MIIKSVKVWKGMGPQGEGDRVDYIIVRRGGEAKMDYKLKLPPDMIIHFCTFHIDLMEFSCWQKAILNFDFVFGLLQNISVNLSEHFRGKTESY